jgi:hypothetical protein
MYQSFLSKSLNRIENTPQALFGKYFPLFTEDSSGRAAKRSAMAGVLGNTAAIKCALPIRNMQVRVLEIGGIAANALLAFAWHAKAFNLIRRRQKNMREPYSNPVKCQQPCQRPNKWLITTGLALLQVLPVGSSEQMTFWINNRTRMRSRLGSRGHLHMDKAVQVDRAFPIVIRTEIPLRRSALSRSNQARYDSCWCLC